MDGGNHLIYFLEVRKMNNNAIDYPSRYNPKFHVFGPLCIRNHNHKDGQSIRNKREDDKLGKCIQCFKEGYPKLESISNQLPKGINKLDVNYKKLFNSDRHYYGLLCFRNHNHFNNHSIRYLKDNTCLQCRKERDNQLEVKLKKQNRIVPLEVKQKTVKNNLIRNKEKRKKDNAYKSYQNLARMLRLFLKGAKAGKSWKTFVEFSSEEYYHNLISLLPSSYVKNDIGSLLHVDHIIPQSWFKEINDVESFRLCWCLKNFQLLTKNQNQTKKDIFSGSPTKKIITKIEFLQLVELFPLKLLCNSIWNEYYF
jgi:hypothetical protein